jgi:hypothetical protein
VSRRKNLRWLSFPVLLYLADSGCCAGLMVT